MGINTLPRITAQLIKHGRDANTPAALIRKGTLAGATSFSRHPIASLAELSCRAQNNPTYLNCDRGRG